MDLSVSPWSRWARRNTRFCASSVSRVIRSPGMMLRLRVASRLGMNWIGQRCCSSVSIGEVAERIVEPVIDIREDKVSELDEGDKPAKHHDTAEDCFPAHGHVSAVSLLVSERGLFGQRPA